jgi:hypothetical protein
MTENAKGHSCEDKSTIWLILEDEGGSTFTMEFRKNETIGDVRRALHDHFGKDLDLNMSFKTIALIDGTKRLYELEIENLSRISLGGGHRVGQAPAVQEVESVVHFLKKDLTYFAPTPMTVDLISGVVPPNAPAPVKPAGKNMAKANPVLVPKNNGRTAGRTGGPKKR